LNLLLINGRVHHHDAEAGAYPISKKNDVFRFGKAKEGEQQYNQIVLLRSRLSSFSISWNTCP
jgi:hypothetical protein